MNGHLNHPKNIIDLGKDILEDLTVHENVQQKIIVITEDKLRLILIKRKPIAKFKSDMLVSFGILLTVLAALVSTDFKDTFLIKKENWEFIFKVGFLLSLGWLVISIIKYIKYYGKSEIEEIIRDIKGLGIKIDKNKYNYLKPTNNHPAPPRRIYREQCDYLQSY